MKLTHFGELSGKNDAEWTCGHVAGAVCANCYHSLARRAYELQAEVDWLRQLLEETNARAKSR